MAIGNNGLIERTGIAKDETTIAQEKEQVGLAYTSAFLNKTSDNITAGEMQTEMDAVAGDGNTLVSQSTYDLLSVYYKGTKHMYNVSVKTGEINYNKINMAELDRDPIKDISSTYILRESGKLSTYHITERNRDNEEYDPIESNETVIGNNPKEIGDGYYIDSENCLHMIGKEQKINNIKSFDILNEYALTNDGKLYLWGRSGSKIIGNGSTNNSDGFICTNTISGNALYGKNIVSCGIFGGCYAIDSDGKAYTWGAEEYNCSNGILGNGTTSNTQEPTCITDIPNSPLYQKKIKAMEIGEYNSWAIDEQGKLYVWGHNFDGNIGNGRHGSNTNSALPVCISDITSSALYGKKIKSVIVNTDGSSAIDEEGNLYTWGTSWVVRLGANMTDNSSYNYLPVAVSNIQGSPLYNKKIKSANISNDYCYALDEEGKIYTWGHNYCGNTGTGTSNQEVYMPVCLNNVENSAIYGKKIKEVYSNNLTTYVTDEDGIKYAWGQYANSNIPKILEDEDKNIIKTIEYYRNSDNTDYGAINITEYLNKNGKMFVTSRLSNYG